jgi:hypothetical protein
MGDVRKAYRIAVGKLQLKRPIARHRRTWEDNIKTNLKGVGPRGVTLFVILRIGTSAELF